jgi:hypothetical protein
MWTSMLFFSMVSRVAEGESSRSLELLLGIEKGYDVRRLKA